jgi:hypothetical protein
LKRSGRKGSGQKDSARTNGETVWQLRQGKPVSFTRYVNNGELSIGAVDQGYSTVFALNFVPGVTDFSALFDQYRIDRVEYVFEMDIADGSLNSTTKWPRIIVAPDFNNQAAPITENDVLVYEQSKQYQFSTSERRFSVVLKPMVAASIYRTGISNGYEMKPSGWLDMATTDVPHYGVRFWVNNHNSTNFGSSRIRTYTRYWMSFRNAA